LQCVMALANRRLGIWNTGIAEHAPRHPKHRSARLAVLGQTAGGGLRLAPLASAHCVPPRSPFSLRQRRREPDRPTRARVVFSVRRALSDRR
jgi:hypothetical protein